MGEETRRNRRRPTWLWPLWFFAMAACVKILLIPSHHSTDFEVHRHWLALTHSLPLSQWYSDETSPWTLDYPPLFAYFECLLSFPARLVDSRIVDVRHGIDYKSNSVVYFQRISVIVADLSLLFGVHKLTKNLRRRRRMFTTMMVMWSPGLVIVDHVHFQYNGFLLGMLLLSVSYLRDGRDLMGGFVFAALLCFKHLFAAAAPVYFFYLLRHYCWKGFAAGSRRILAMGVVVVSVFAVAYGPFVYLGQMGVVVGRLFPFGRGLCHAYWAPNIWVFYIILDKVLALALRKFGIGCCHASAASFTGGLVGNSPRFSVLPQVSALATFVLVLVALCPCMIKIWRNPRPKMTPRWVAYAYTCAFLFGWHVHEKASLHFVIPLALVASESLEDAKHYFLLSIVASYSLFPLLHLPQEYPIKVVLLLLQSAITWQCFSSQFSNSVAVCSKQAKSQACAQELGGFKLGPVAKCYLAGLVLVEAWQLLHPHLLGNQLPFLPLMLISAYCAIGVLFSWACQLCLIIQLN